MKNRVLRSALAVILVIAMVLTMAACDNSSDDVVTTTTTPAATAAPATETPVAPTEAPVVTTAPTVAPTTSATKDTVADDFGITLEAFDGTYGTKITNADGDKLKDYLSEEGGFSTSDIYAYSVLNVSKSNIMDEDYSIEIKLDETVIYTGSTAYLGAAGSTSASLTGIDVTDFYDGDATVAYANFYFIDEDEIYITYDQAGTYEFEFEVTIKEAAANYGAWDLEDRDEWETEITLVATVAKEELTIEVDAIVVMEDEDSELYIDEETGIVYVGSVPYASFPTLAGYGDLDEHSSYELEYSLNYTKKAAVGEYEVVMTIIEKSSDDEMDLDDVNDELTNQTIVGITPATIYVVSEYDWNEIRDVVTSIGEINYDENGFYGDNSNLATQAVLALARYNALSTQQQAYFDNGVVSDLGTYIITENVGSYLVTAEYYDFLTTYSEINSVSALYTALVNEFDLANDSDETTHPGKAFLMWLLSDYMTEGTSFGGDGGIGQAGTISNKGIDDDEVQPAIAAALADLAVEEKLAANFLDFLEDAEEAIEEKYIMDAFQDVFDDSDMEDYFTGTAYATDNSSAITAYNTVDTYWNSLSDDDQEVIEDNYTTAGGDYDAYYYYDLAVDAFDATKVDAALELTAGAFAAYIKAIDNGATQIYVSTEKKNDFTTWVYINSTEVKTLTAQAQAAYDALTDAQQDVFDEVVDDVLDANLVITTNAGAAGVVYSKATGIEYIDVLKQLKAMNSMVDTMIVISNYVNIEDYSTDDLLYARLKMLVYGDYSYYEANVGEVTSDAVFGMFFPATTGVTRFAMDDIMDAPSRNYDAIIAEYQAWIDYLLDLEDYKAGLADEFEAAVAEYFSGNEDYTDKVASYAVDNDEYDAIIDAIMGEGLVDILSTSLSPTYYSATSIDTAIKAEIGTVITASFLTTWDIEDFETAYEAMIDAFDIEEIIDIYCEAFVTE